MKYTLQHELDDGEFGDRWGCAFVGVINAGEHSKGRKATRVQVSILIGEAFRTFASSMSNYKHDKYVRPRRKPPAGWGSKSNPEWHYLVENWAKMVKIVEEAMDTKIVTSRYEIAVMRTQFGGKHYCLRADRVLLINPDPSLYGDIEEYLPLVA